MPKRMQKTTPFQEGQNTNDHKGISPKAPILEDSSKHRTSPGHDPLRRSLGAGMPETPVRYHLGDVVAEFHPKGAQYRPDGEFGHLQGGGARGTHYTPHSSPPGKNAVGNNSNRKGTNALDKAMNKVGSKSKGKK